MRIRHIIIHMLHYPGSFLQQMNQLETFTMRKESKRAFIEKLRVILDADREEELHARRWEKKNEMRYLLSVLFLILMLSIPVYLVYSSWDSEHGMIRAVFTMILYGFVVWIEIGAARRGEKHRER